MKITDIDMQFIAPVVSLVLWRGCFNFAKDSKVKIVYASNNPVLEDTILDKKAADIGSSLIKQSMWLHTKRLSNIWFGKGSKGFSEYTKDWQKYNL